MSMKLPSEAIYSEPIYFADQLDNEDIKKVLLLLINKLGMTLTKTNANKHGRDELVLEYDAPDEPEVVVEDEEDPVKVAWNNQITS